MLHPIILSKGFFTPKNLPGLQAWYDVTKPLYTDTAKTTLAVNQDDRVAVLPDWSGNNRDLIRTTDDTWRPVLRNNVYRSESKRTLRFTSGSHAMATTATWIAFPAKRGSMYIVMFAGGSEYKLATIVGNTKIFVVYSNPYTNEKIYDTSDRSASSPDSKLGLQVQSLIRTADTVVTYYRDGVLDGDITIGNAQCDEGVLKLSNAAGNGLAADVCEIILLDHASNAVERTKIETYLMRKWLDPVRTPVWTRVGDALVAGVGDDNNLYEATALYEGSPQILPGPNVFKMWFTNEWETPSINYAESADGVSWTRYESNPVIAAGCRSCIVKNGEDYWLYVKTDDVNIDLHTSEDGLSWVEDTTDCLTPGGAGAWDSDRVDNMFVWQEGPSDWRMLYDGKAVADPYYSLGYATSEDGKTWTKYAGNPVIRNAGGPCMRKIGSTYWLWGHTWIEGTSTLPSDIFRYHSTDCIHWTRDPAHAPALSRIAAEEGVGYIGPGQAADAWIMEVGGACYLFYSASANGASKTGAMRIRLATAAMTLAQLVTTQEGA
jgi:hypothetical protein